MNVSATMFSAALALLEGRGQSVEDVCRSLGITPGSLKDLDMRFPIMAWSDLWALIERTSSDPCVGIHAAEQLAWGHFDVIDYIGATSRDLREGFLGFQRFARLLSNSVAWELETEARGAWVIRRTLRKGTGLTNRHEAEFPMACLILRGSRATLTDWMPRIVEFQYPAPPDPSGYHRIFGPEVHFDASRDAFFLDEETLEIPMKNFDTALNAIIERQASLLLNAIPGEPSLLANLRVMIRREFHRGRPRIDTVAKAMGMSGRSLQRQLLLLSTSYQAIVQEECIFMAKDYLNSTSLSVAEIAMILGYSGTSAFHRAFCKATGSQPRTFRKS